MGRIDSDLKRITSEPWLVWQCWWATFSARAKWRSFMSAGSSVEKKYLTGRGVVREAMFQQLTSISVVPLCSPRERVLRLGTCSMGRLLLGGLPARPPKRLQCPRAECERYRRPDHLQPRTS